MAPRPSRIVIQTTVDAGRLPANWVGRQSEPGQGVMTPRRWRPIAATPIGGEADRRHEARRAAKTEAVLDRTRVPPKVDRFRKWYKGESCHVTFNPLAYLTRTRARLFHRVLKKLIRYIDGDFACDRFDDCKSCGNEIP